MEQEGIIIDKTIQRNIVQTSNPYLNRKSKFTNDRKKMVFIVIS